MIPEQRLSTQPVKGIYLYPDNVKTDFTLDFEMGGVDLNDPSQGLNIKSWAASIAGQDIVLYAEDREPLIALTRPGVLTEVSLAFDQNMRPTIAFVEDGLAYLYWYNTEIGSFDITLFADAITPRVCLDDKRQLQSAASDIILAYIKDNTLFFRAQRDRFTIEYPLATGIVGKLVKVGMTDQSRLQFEIQPFL